MITICYNCMREIDREGDPIGSPIKSPPNNSSHGLCEECVGIENRRLLDEAKQLRKESFLGMGLRKMKRGGRK